MPTSTAGCHHYSMRSGSFELRAQPLAMMVARTRCRDGVSLLPVGPL